MPESQELIVARCGLVCSFCGSHVKGKCPGCHSDQAMFRGCPVKACTQKRQARTCADCADHADLRQCSILYSRISRFIGWIFGTNRVRNLEEIRRLGWEGFCKERSQTRQK